jgi:hypothetical protein
MPKGERNLEDRSESDDFENVTAFSAALQN